MNNFLANADKDTFNNSIIGVKNITKDEIVNKSKEILYIGTCAIIEFDTVCKFISGKSIVYEYNQGVKAYNEIRTIIEPIMVDISKEDYSKWADNYIKLNTKYKRVLALRDIIMHYTNICHANIALNEEQTEIIKNIKKERNNY